MILRATTALLFLLASVASASAGSSAGWPKPGSVPSASGGPEIVFSFDDGPHARYTPKLLDVLERHGVQGLFFWVGNRVDENHPLVEEHVAIAERAVREGHLVGTHTQNHVHLCSVARKVAIREIDAAIARYEQITGMPMKLFRAPYGNHCPRLVTMLAERGIDHTHWDIDPHEWEDHNPGRVAKHIVDQIRNKQGRSVILMHDTMKVTVEAVDLVLTWIEKENQRRTVEGTRPIRVVAPSNWIAESFDREIRSVLFALGEWAVSEAKNVRVLIPGYSARVVSR